MDFDEARRILAALEREGVRYVLVGSMAMAAHGIVRATRDMDLFVSPDPDNVERLRRALRSLFEGDSSVEEIIAEDLAGEYPAVQYVPPHGLYSLDILARLGDAYRRGRLMGVRKYRSVEDMPGPPPRRRLDPDNLRLALGLADFARRIRPLRNPAGVRKDRSYEELLQGRDGRPSAPGQRSS
jgi:hypothetical protein